MPQKIAIAGAGLVGSLLAIYLAKRGHDIDVYERRQDMRKLDIDGGRSINLAMSTRGWRALRGVGLDEKVSEIAIPMHGRMIHHLDGTQELQPYGKPGQSIYSVDRAELNRILMNSAEAHENVNFHFEQKCRKVDLKNREIQFENMDTGGYYTINPDLIFGADGAFSNVRSSMQRTNRFNYSQYFLPHGYKELTIPPGENGSFQMEKNALHIWPRKSFMLIALPNPDGSFTCTLFLAFEGEVSFEQLKDNASVLRFFETYFPDAMPLMPDLLTDFKENPSSSLITVRCSPWTKYGHTALIGDASHAIVPFYGQGMNSGFEDCYVLDQIMEAHSTVADEEDGDRDGEELEINWSRLLYDYEQSRIPDANAIADLAMRNFVEMRDSVTDPNYLLKKKIEKWLNAHYGDERYLPLYSMVTFSDLRYSEAQYLAQQQDRLFEEKIFPIPDVEARFDAGDEALKQQLLDLVEAAGILR